MPSCHTLGTRLIMELFQDTKKEGKDQSPLVTTGTDFGHIIASL